MKNEEQQANFPHVVLIKNAQTDFNTSIHLDPIDTTL